MTAVFYHVFDLITTAFETFLLWYLLRNKKSDRSTILIISYYAVLFLIVVLSTMFEFSLVVKVVIQLLYVSFIGRKLYRSSLINLTLIFLLYITVNMVSEIAVVQMWDLIVQNPIIISIGDKKTYIVQLIIMAKILNLGLVLFVDKMLKFKRDINVFRDLPHFIFTVISSLAIAVCIYSIILHVEETRYIFLFLICIILSLISLIYNTAAAKNFLEMKRAEQVEKYLNYELELRCQYYQNKLKDQERIKETYHDFKNHLLILENSNANGNNEIIEMIEHLKDKISVYDNYYSTGNEYLDIILNEKILMAKELKIDTEISVDPVNLTFLTPIDISTIFGNLFDNAIEANVKNSEENRYLFLRVSLQNHIFSIVMRNKAEHYTGIKTSKEDKFTHGYGITNIEKAVHKYDGACSIQVEDLYFTYSIIIPMKKEWIF